MALFSAADKARIEARIEQLEARSAGEVVVAAVPRSDEYATRRWLCAFSLVLASSAIIARFWLALSIDWLLLSEVPLALLFFRLSGWSPLTRWLVPKAERDAAVQARAARMFAERRVYATRDATGVLIMLSELERRVVIVADHGIDAHIQAIGWQTQVGKVTAAIRAGRAVEGVCGVLDELDEVLANAFPQRTDDENELSNRVVEER